MKSNEKFFVYDFFLSGTLLAKSVCMLLVSFCCSISVIHFQLYIQQLFYTFIVFVCTMAYRLSGCDGDPGTLFEANFIYIIAKMRSLPDPAGGLTAPPSPPAVLHAASGSVGLGNRGSHSPREKPPTKVLHQAPHIGNPALVFVYIIRYKMQ